MSEDRWAPLADRFVDGHYGSLRGRVRTHVIDRQLRWHLPAPPAAIVDVGGGAGHQVLPLARDGYDVTIVDPSTAMLARAEELVSRELTMVASYPSRPRTSGALRCVPPWPAVGRKRWPPSTDQLPGR